jgi:adenylate cyclase
VRFRAMTYITVRVDAPQRRHLLVVLEDELVVGRDCDGLLVGDPQVSRRHLRLRRFGSKVEIADLDSTNGTSVDGMSLTGTTTVERTSRVLIGDTMLTICFDPVRSGEQPPTGRATTLRGDDLRATSIDVLAESVTSRTEDEPDGSLTGDTMTIVFSDIEGSTERATAMGDEDWYSLLEEHNRIVRSALGEVGGREVKSIGDGFMMVFPSVRRALRFAVEVQRRVEAPDGPDLRVRVGLHTGEAIHDADGDLFGRHVNLAARVANLAGGGQIVASLVSREIAAGRDDVTFGEPQQVELKGFTEPQIVYEVLWAR